MRSNSPFPVRNSPYARSRSFSHYSDASSPLPVNSQSFADTTFSYPGRTPSPYPRRVSRDPAESGLDRVSERTQGSCEEESEPLLGSSEEDSGTAVYTRRWYLLLVFSFLALMQTMSWAFWGPISESAEAVFSWEDSDITMCLFLGNLSFCICCIPFSWLMDQRGLRVSMVVASFFIVAGAGLRCLIQFVPSSYHTWCIYGGQFLNGVAGPVAQGGGALFSNLWFPNNQRATSTAISTFIGYAGSALAFTLGPLLIPSPSDKNPGVNNNTLPNGNLSEELKLPKIQTGSGNSSDPNNHAAMMDAILQYLDYQALAAVVLFLLVVVYFPDRPPHPPSLSAAAEREDFGPGLAKLLKNKQFWLISAAFCLSLGVFEVWDVVLDVNLSPIGISQETAGWLGFYCVMAGCLTGLLICRLADIFFRQIRLFLILSYAVSTIFVLWFILIYINVLPFDLVSIYAAIILSGVFLDGCSPLVYELICEAAYPVGEGVSSCFLQMLFVLVGMAFAAVQNVPNIGTAWMNWCLLGSLCAATPLLFLVTDTYGRADLDALDDQVVVVNPPDDPKPQDDQNEKAPLTLPKTIPSSNRPSPILRSGYGSCNPSPPPVSPFSRYSEQNTPHNSGTRDTTTNPPTKPGLLRCRSQPDPSRRASRVHFEDECAEGLLLPRRAVSSLSEERSVSHQDYVLNVDKRDVDTDRREPSGNGESGGDVFGEEQGDVFGFEHPRTFSGSLFTHRQVSGASSSSDPSREGSLLTSGGHSVDLSFLRVDQGGS